MESDPSTKIKLDNLIQSVFTKTSNDSLERLSIGRQESLMSRPEPSVSSIETNDTEEPISYDNFGFWGGQNSSVSLSSKMSAGSRSTATGSLELKQQGNESRDSTTGRKSNLRNAVSQVEEYVLPGTDSAQDIIRRIGKNRNWTEQEIESDLAILDAHRLRTVNDMRTLSETGWGNVPLLPLAKESIRNLISAKIV